MNNIIVHREPHDECREKSGYKSRYIAERDHALWSTCVSTSLAKEWTALAPDRRPTGALPAPYRPPLALLWPLLQNTTTLVEAFTNNYQPGQHLLKATTTLYIDQ